MPAQLAVLHVYVDTYDKPTQTFWSFGNPLAHLESIEGLCV